MRSRAAKKQTRLNPTNSLLPIFLNLSSTCQANAPRLEVTPCVEKIAFHHRQMMTTRLEQATLGETLSASLALHRRIVRMLICMRYSATVPIAHTTTQSLQSHTAHYQNDITRLSRRPDPPEL